MIWNLHLISDLYYLPYIFLVSWLPLVLTVARPSLHSTAAPGSGDSGSRLLLTAAAQHLPVWLQDSRRTQEPGPCTRHPAGFSPHRNGNAECFYFLCGELVCAWKFVLQNPIWVISYDWRCVTASLNTQFPLNIFIDLSKQLILVLLSLDLLCKF